MQYKVLSKLYYQGKEVYEETYKRRINNEATYHFPFKINDDNAFVVMSHEVLQKIDEIKLSSCQDIRDLYNELLLRDVVAENIAHRPDGAIFRKNGVRVCGNYDKVDYREIYARPHIKTIKSLEENNDCLEMYMNFLPEYL